VPTIQLYQHQSNLRAASGPHANPNVFGAQTAQALGEVSATIGQVGQKLADAADYRAITEYQLQEQEFNAKQEKWLLENPHAETKDILKRYKVERDAFNQSQLKPKHLSKRAREKIGLMTREATAKGELDTTQIARTREIKRAQAVSDTIKKQAIQRGDLDAFLRLDQDIEHGITYPELREHEINHAKQQIQQIHIQRRIVEAQESPPAHASAQITETIEALQNGETYSALSYAQTTQALAQAQTLRRAQQAKIAGTARNALEAIATGEADETLLHTLYEDGRIDRETFEFITDEPLETAQERYKQAKDKRQAQTFHQLAASIAPKKGKPATLSHAQIDQARDFGYITEDKALKLHAQLRNQALYEQNLQDGHYKTILKEISDTFTTVIDGKNREKQVPKTLADLQETAIKIAQAPLSNPSRLKLQVAYLAVYQDQLEQIGQEEIREETSWYRRTPKYKPNLEEKQLRGILKDQILRSPQLRQKGLALKTFLAHEAELRKLFSQDPTFEQIQEFRKNAISQIKYAESASLVKQTYSLNHDYALEEDEEDNEEDDS